MTQVLKHLQQGIPLFCHKLRGTFVWVSVRPIIFFSFPKMCIINNKLKLALEEMFSLFPCSKIYLLFIVDKFATFCVTFLTEVKWNKTIVIWFVYFLSQI